MKKIAVLSLLALFLGSNLNAAVTKPVVQPAKNWKETFASLPSTAISNAVALPKSAWKKATASKTNMAVSATAATAAVVAAIVIYKACNDCPEVRAFLGLDSAKKTKKVKPAAKVS